VSTDIYDPETPTTRRDAARLRAAIEPVPDSLLIFGSEGRRSVPPAPGVGSISQTPFVSDIFATPVRVPIRAVSRQAPAARAPRPRRVSVRSVPLAVAGGIVLGMLLMRFGAPAATTPPPEQPAAAPPVEARVVSAGGVTAPPAVVPAAASFTRPVTDRAPVPADVPQTPPRSERPATVTPPRRDPVIPPTVSSPAARRTAATIPAVPLASTSAAAINALPTTTVPVAAAPAADAATEGNDAREAERRKIRAVLDTYKGAYDRLDPAAASALGPGVDARALGRAFGALTSQRVSFDRCEIGVLGILSSARCVGTVETVRRAGDTQPQRRPASWAFALTQTAGQWQITKVTAR
jgi:hypothetical protein